MLLSIQAFGQLLVFCFMFLIQYKCCIETRFSRCSSQEFAGFTVIKSLNFFHDAAPIKPRSHRSPGAVLYVRNSLHSFI